VTVPGLVFRYQSINEFFKIALGRRICVFLNQERGLSVLNKNIQHTTHTTLFGEGFLNFARDRD
jgi:hypothetical protein